MRNTCKIYYSHQYAKKIQAHIVKVDCESRFVELDRTIAYPEGGGQESDNCIIIHNDTGNTYNINHVKRMYGQDVKISESHYVNVNGIILHYISPENLTSMEELHVGDEVTIEIDTLFREKLTTSHSASHLLYIGVKKIRGDAISGTIGCHIKEGQARFDFLVSQRFSEQDIQKIQDIANSFVEENLEIEVYPSEAHPDARFWECQNNIIPCGGTHLSKTGTIGTLKIKRKNIGKGKDRLICILEKPLYNTKQYQEYTQL